MAGMTAATADLFKGRHFDQEVIILCVRWYLSYKLSSRDLVEIMAERGIELAHTTILRWVQRYVPEFEKRWSRYARTVAGSWRCDETYIKVRGRWTYLYRAVDKHGLTVDFRLSKHRDVAAAKAFFRNAMKRHNWNASRHHSGCLCCLASGGSGPEDRRKDAKAGAGSFEQVSE